MTPDERIAYREQAERACVLGGITIRALYKRLGEKLHSLCLGKHQGMPALMDDPEVARVSKCLTIMREAYPELEDGE